MNSTRPIEVGQRLRLTRRRKFYGVVLEIHEFKYGWPRTTCYEYRVKWDDGSESWIEEFEIAPVRSKSEMRSEA